MEPKIVQRKKQYYVGIRLAVPIPFGKYLGPAWGEVQGWLQSKGVSNKDSGPAIIRYLTTDMSSKLDIDVGFTVNKAMMGDDRIIADFLPAGRYATLLYTGSYKGKGIYKANAVIMEWAKENHIVWSITRKKKVEWWNGRVEWYLTDPAKESDPKKYKTEVAVLLKDKQCKPESPGEQAQPRQDNSFPKIAAPAQRALASFGIHTLQQLSKNTEEDIKQLHGMGPKAINILHNALTEKGLSFAAKK